jgi:hypothetical protein
VAVTPLKATAARQMRRTASDLDRDHPETSAGDHVRDAARVLEHGSTDGSKRHLDAAMEVLTPRNLMRHGILDDEGHATAKQHMHAVNRHRLHVQDIEDAQGRNQRLKEAAAAARPAAPGSVTRAGGANDGPQQAPAPVPPPKPGGSPKAGPGGGQSSMSGVPPDSGPIPTARMRAAERNLANEIALRAAWLDERRDTGGRWTDAGGITAVFGKQKGRRPKPYVSPGQASLNKAIFGKHASKSELDTLAGMFGGVKLKSVSEDRAGLKKSQRAVYDRLRKRGRGHAQAMLVARRFTPEMLKASAFAADACAIVLAFDPTEPRGKGGQWIKSSSRTNAILHGLGNVTGRTPDGTEVTGTYHHYLGTIRPGPGGRPVKVAQVYNPHAAFGRRDAARRRAQQGRPGLLERIANRVGGFGPPVQAAGDGRAVELFNPMQPRGAHGRWVHAGAASVSISKIAGVHGAGSFHHARFMDRYADTQLRNPDSKRLLKMATRAMVRRDFEAAQRHLAGARWHDANFEDGAHLADLDEMARGVAEASRKPALGGRLYLRHPSSAVTPGGQHPGEYRPSKGNLIGYANPMIDMSARTAMLERTPAPRGRPGGPGLYGVKGMGHTAYEQQIVKALIEKRGMPPGKAYAIARAAIRKWSRGGGHVHPEVRAAAGRAEAGELQRQARAKAHAIDPWEVADTLVELAVISLYNPYHAPPGAGGGQFVTAQGSGGAQQQQAARKREAAQVAARKRQAGQAAAADKRGDRAQAAAIGKQIRGLQAQLVQVIKALRAIGGSVPSGKAKTGKAGTGKAGTAAAAAKTKAGAAAKSKSSTPRKVSPATAARRKALAAQVKQIRAKIATLQIAQRQALA